MSNIQFEDWIFKEDTATTILYFITTKEHVEDLSGKEYPEAIHGEICIETPGIFPMAEDALVTVSPTMDCEDGTVDYDWTGVQIPLNEVQELIDIAEKEHYKPLTEEE